MITLSFHPCCVPIEASLSLKFGEMLSLMVAIVLGIVTPLKPTVQLLNLFLTHVLCTWSFAFEEAEDYIMTIPPRNVKKDLDGGYPESLETVWKGGWGGRPGRMSETWLLTNRHMNRFNHHIYHFV